VSHAFTFRPGSSTTPGPVDMPRQRHRDNWRLWPRDLQRRENTVHAERAEAVLQARADGASWDAIAAELGVSKAAAYKRYRGHEARRRADEAEAEQ